MPRDNPPLSVEEEARRAIERSLSRGDNYLAIHGEIPAPLDTLFPLEPCLRPYSPKETSASNTSLVCAFPRPRNC